MAMSACGSMKAPAPEPEGSWPGAGEPGRPLAVRREWTGVFIVMCLALIGLEPKSAASSVIPGGDPHALPLLLDRGEGRGEESGVCVARETSGRSHPSPRPSPLGRDFAEEGFRALNP